MASGVTLSAKTLARIAASVAAAPPLTTEQIAELRRILRPGEMLFRRMPAPVSTSDPAPLQRAA